jgi:hypothetical protein
MIIPGQFGFNYPSGFREEAFTWIIETKLPRNDHWKVLYKILFFMPIGNPRWLPPQVILLTQDHMGKIQKYVLL